MAKKYPFMSYIAPEMPLRKIESRCSSREEWKRVVQDLIQRYSERLSKREGREQLDLGGPMLKRRTDAILDSIDEAYMRYSDQLDCFPDDRSFGEEWIWLNLPHQTYTSAEDESFLLFGAALWILDQIDGFENRQILYKLLPQDDGIYDEMDWPDVWDSKHDYFLIADVMYLLQERHSDISKPEFIAGMETRRVFTDSVNALGKQSTHCPSMDRYRDLIRLIPKENIDRAVERYRELFWAWADRYFKASSHLMRRLTAAQEQADESRKQFNESRARFIKSLETIEENRKQIKNAAKKHGAGSPLLVPLAKPDDSHIPNFQMSFGSQLPLVIRSIAAQQSPEEQEARRLGKQLIQLSDAAVDLSKSVETAHAKYRIFWAEMIQYGILTKKHAQKEFGKEVADDLNLLRIENPYEICFALLYLLESGDDLPWLYGPSVGLMKEVAESLPWGIYPYEEDEDMVWFPDDDYEPEAVKPSAIPDWYERKYVYSSKYREDDFPRSLAQIVYEETGCLMPRDMHMYDSVTKELSRYGIRGKDAIALQYCMLALAHARHQPRPSRINYEELFGPEEPVQQAAPSEHQTYDQLMEKTEKQKREIETLRAALHEAERTAADRQRELERTKHASDLERRELADLRERVFLQSSEEEETILPEDEAAFPYEVTSETVVFGGHPSWSKAIRPLLTGNVRFLDKDKSFDQSVIRHADVVWIQANALSHSMFYSIIEEARRCKKPVRYFSYASAVKCAKQLMEADQSYGK